MRNRKEVGRLSAHTRSTKASARHNGDGNPPNVVQFKESLQPDWPIPYLETIVVAAKKYPYTAIGVMISIAAVVISAVTVLSVSVIGGMFIMYGQMTKIAATQETILTQYAETRAEVQNTGNVMRAYEAANGKRIEFLVGLMSPQQQARANEYDRTHPQPLVLEKPRTNKEN